LKKDTRITFPIRTLAGFPDAGVHRRKK